MRSFLLHQLLRANVAAGGESPALQVDGCSMSYAELDARSAALADRLRALGVRRHDRVGIYLPKNLAAYTGIFAILRLGAAYVPLDPSAPAQRIRYMIENGRLRALVSEERLIEGLEKDPDAPSLPPWVAPAETPDASLETASPPDEDRSIEEDLAYILYTSGSTGLPKGVMISHRAAMAFVDWAASTFRVTPQDRVAGVAALHFDLSVFDLFATVAGGGTLIPLPPGIILRPAKLVEWIDEQKISIWYSTPSTLQLLLKHGLTERELPSLRCILFAGEVFPTRQLRRLREAFPHAELHNLYGPTETNVCTWKHVVDIPDDDAQTITIGAACANAEVKTLDPEGRETEVGREGELWVRGPHLLTGYWDDPERTERVLQRMPDVEPPGALWYRTGDLAHRDEHGEFHFHGRRDHMVKIRGYRIELGEVEAALSSHEEVLEQAVVALRDEAGQAFLRAYLAVREPESFSIIRMKAFLGRRLPAYMIPGEMRGLSELPKTSTGKVDRRRLVQDAEDSP